MSTPLLGLLEPLRTAKGCGECSRAGSVWSPQLSMAPPLTPLCTGLTPVIGETTKIPSRSFLSGGDKQHLYSVYYSHGVDTQPHPECFPLICFLILFHFLTTQAESSSPASLLIRNSIFKSFLSSHILSQAVKRIQAVPSILCLEIPSAKHAISQLTGSTFCKTRGREHNSDKFFAILLQESHFLQCPRTHFLFLRPWQNGPYCPCFSKHSLHDHLAILWED